MEKREYIISILKLSNQIRRELNYVTDYSGIQIYILFFILNSYRTQDIYQKDLKKEFNICGASISSALKQMEKEGLIFRERISDDNRLKKVMPTARAFEIEEQIGQLIDLLEKKITEGIDQQQLEAFLETSEWMICNMKEMRK